MATVRVRVAVIAAVSTTWAEVAAPQLIYAVDAEFSDEARAKFQGVCVVSLVWMPRSPSAFRWCVIWEWGWEQKADAAVQQYRFKPAMLQGRAVPVEVNIEVNFRICLADRSRYTVNVDLSFHWAEGQGPQPAQSFSGTFRKATFTMVVRRSRGIRHVKHREQLP